jgi:hypothetical protein
MMGTSRKNGDDLRAAAKLVVDATRGVTDLVEEMHVTIASGPAILGRPLRLPTRAVTAVTYGATRGITRLVGLGIDTLVAQLTPVLGESEPGPQREAIVSALNAVLGDHLDATGNPLAISMVLRSKGKALRLERDALRAASPYAGGKVLVLVHGSGMNDRQWTLHGHDHGTALARDLGYTPVYVHYNTGLHVSTNGRRLATLLDDLVRAWPTPVEEVCILAHSMGGLVARSACLVADADVGRFAWRSKLRDLVFLGTPHHGSPLERGGNLADVLLGLTPYSAPLGRLARIRGAGVTDMRFGYVLDEHWMGRARFARADDPRHDLTLPEGVSCYAVAGTTASRLGDGLVPVDSALGRHARPDLTLRFPPSHQWIAADTGHLELLHRPEVYEKIRGWLGDRDRR